MNREGKRIDGRPRREIVGQVIWKVWPPLLGTPFEAAYRRVLKEQVPVEIKHRCVDGDRDLWFEIRAYPTPDSIAVFFRDITNRKRAKEERAQLRQALAAERTLLEAELRHMRAGVMVAKA